MATLVMPKPPPPVPLSRKRSRPTPGTEPLALQCRGVAFSFGNAMLGRPLAAPPPAFAQGAGATLSAGGSRLAADQVAEIRVVSLLPPDATTVTVQPHPGSAVLAITVHDAEGGHALPLDCAGMLAGWWQLGTDRLGRDCWLAGEAVLPLPPLHGAAKVEVTLVEV